METELIELIVDGNSRRPYCVLLQSAYGCGHNNSFLSRTFDCKHWILAPTDIPRRVSGTKAQWERHAELLDVRYKKV